MISFLTKCQLSQKLKNGHMAFNSACDVTSDHIRGETLFIVVINYFGVLPHRLGMSVSLTKNHRTASVTY